MSLADVNKGDKAVITSINAETALKKRLATMGITKNKEVAVDEVSLGSNNIKISIGGSDVALRLSEAQKIEVAVR